MTTRRTAGGAAPTDAWRWTAPVAALVFGTLLAAAAFFAFRGRDLFGDEASFCTIGQGIVRGALPYRDLFNEKPPLQYFLTAAVMAFAGPTLDGARAASAIVLALTAAAIVLGPLARRAGGLATAGIMAATAAVAVELDAYHNTADATLALIYVLGAIVLACGPGRWGGVLMGALHGVALGFRQTATGPIAALLLAPRMAGARVAFGVGVAVGLAAWLGPLFAAGLFGDLVRATVLFQSTNSEVGGYFHAGVDSPAGVAVWGLLAAAAILRPGRSPAERLWTAAWLAMLALAYVGRKSEFRLWPSAAVALATIAWEMPPQGAPVAPGRAWAAAPLALAVLVAATTVFRFPPRDLSMEADAARLQRIAGPGDTIWVGPFLPQFYCLSGRRPASRYYFVLPWTAKPQVRREILADIAAKRPVLVISRGFFDIDALLPGLEDILRTGYRAIPAAGHRVIYQPVAPADAARTPSQTSAAAVG